MGVDFAIVTALDEERDAVIAHMPFVKVDPSDHDIRVYWRCAIESVSPSGRSGMYDSVLLSLPSTGRVEAATATSDAIRRWRPRYVILVGIAGGLEEAGIQLGDVLVSDQVIDYEVQKITTDGPSDRFSVHRADPRLLAAARNFHGAWKAGVTARRPVEGRAKVHFGPIATGDKVVAVRDFLRLLCKSWPKLIGVEMEAGGAAAAAFQAASPPGFFMIRGTSDLADSEKDAASTKLWRESACHAPANFLFDFLRSGPVPFRNPIEPKSDDRYSDGYEEDAERDHAKSESGAILINTATHTEEIELIIPNRKPSELSREERAALERAISELLKIDSVTIRKVREGSTIVSIKLTPEQAERLLWAARAGELAKFGVDDARIVSVDQMSEASESDSAFPSSRGASDTAPSVSMLRIYRSGEGTYLRVATAIAIVTVLLGGAKWVFDELTSLRWVSEVASYIRDSVPILIVLGGFWTAYLLTARYRVYIDFLIATEKEIRKMQWTSVRALSRAALAVLVTMAILATSVFLVNQFAIWVFGRLGLTMPDAP